MRVIIVFIAILSLVHGRALAENDDAWKHCANVNQPDLAISACTRIIEQGGQWLRNTTIVHIYRGIAFAKKGEINRAIADYDKAIELSPKNAIAYNNRGYAYNELGQYDRAIADFDQAIDFDPKSSTAYNNRGYAYFNKGAFDRAVADYDQAIKLDPRYAKAYRNRAMALMKKRDYARAIADFDQAIQLNPSDAIAYHNRGVANERAGRKALALNDYKRAAQLKPGSRSYKRATARLSAPARSKPKPTSTVRANADYVSDCVKGKAATKIDGCTKAIASGKWQGSRLSWAYANRGLAYRRMGALDSAIADFDQAIKLSPKSATAYNHRGIAYNNKGDFGRAIADYDRAIRLNPNDATAYFNRAIANEKAGRNAPALRDYKKAVELNPGSILFKKALSMRLGGNSNGLTAANSRTSP